MKQSIRLGLVLLLLLGLPGHTTATRALPPRQESRPQGVCPPVQNTPFFTLAYGAVTLDGVSAPVGTVVEARSPRGDVVGCFEVTTAGNYGMMYVYGEDTTVTPPIPGMRASESVAFYVNGSPATATPTLTWANDKTWHEVNLVAVGTPHADFSGTPRQGPAALSVTFTNLSTGNYATCAWTFGDGGTSASCSHPSHTYTTPGVYTVSLTISGALGSDTETKTGYITVYTPVNAQFSGAPTSGTAPLAVTFSNASTGDYTTCAWAFGDGGTSNACNPPAYTYHTPGVYPVSLTVSGPGGGDTETKTDYITVYTPVNAQFSGTPTVGPAALAVAFTNTSTGDYTTCAWTFGDGGTSNACNPPGYTYNTPGAYTVALTVSGSGGSDTETKNAYITVYTPVNAQFSGTPTSGGAPLTVTFTNTATGDYATCAWTFGDGGTSSLCVPPSHTYAAPGTYTVTLTVSGLGGADTESKSAYITVYAPPVAAFSGAPTAGPAALAVTFTNLSTGDFDTCAWTFGDGGTSSVCAAPQHTYTAAGVYTVTLLVSGPSGTDTHTEVAYITVYDPVAADFSGAPTAGIASLPVIFTNLSGGIFESCAWDFGDGATSTVCTDPEHVYVNAGLYTVTLTVSGLGGSDTEIKTHYITVYAPPTAAFSGTPLAGVAPHAVQFSNLSTGDYATCVWQFGDGLTSDSCIAPLHTYANPGVYTVTLTVNGPGGSAIEIKPHYITVYQPVNAAFSAQPVAGAAPLTVTLTNLSTGDYTTCAWDFGDGHTSTVCSQPAHTYTGPGLYTISLQISGPGGSDTETKTQHIRVYAPPVADFSSTPTSGAAPLDVTFSNFSTGDFSNCTWAFGDGNTNTSCNPAPHRYQAPGVYTVMLAITGLGGSDTETKVNYITVYAPPVANFMATPTAGPAALLVEFTNQTTGVYTTCLWAFGDGGSSTACHPQHTYLTPGTYTVLLMVSGPGGSDSATKSNYITVSVPVAADFSATPTAGVAPLPVTFTNLSTGDYTTCAWVFGDGATSNTCTPPVHTYTTPGIYTVTLAVSGPGGSDTEIKSTCITVYTAPRADFSATPLQGAAPLLVTFTNLAVGDYASSLWDFGDGITSTVSHPTHIYTVAGVYTVSLTIHGQTGDDTKIRTDFITVRQDYTIFLPLVLRGN